jgi:TonB family protein
MNDALMYFLKVNIAIVLFYLFFRLAFYNDTFWKTRRFYLLFSMLISFVYPFISFAGWLEKQEPMQKIVINYRELEGITVTARSASMLIVENILLAVYALVSVVLLGKMLVQLISILRWKWKGEKQLLQGTEIISVKETITPFSFFNIIFMNPTLHNEHERNEILTHELTHARQLHSLDVLIAEMLTIICWINPAAWLLRREVRQNLEFLADNSVLESGFDSKNYQYHLLQLSYQTPEVKLGNKFNVSPLKKRITMMNQQKTAKAGLLKYSLIVPLALALVLSSNAETIVSSAKDALSSTESTLSSAIKVLSSAKVAVAVAKKEIQIPDVATAQEAKSVEQQTDNNKIYTVVEKMPQFPGGEKNLLEYINNNVKYPADAFQSGIQGKLIVRFTVNESGKVGTAEVIRSLSPSIDAEGLRVIKSLPDFIPGEQNGKKVVVWYTMPITFRIDGESKENKVYNVIEKMPQFPGGEQELLNYIVRNLKYPVEAQKTGTQGKVIIRFIVSATGKVENPTKVKSTLITTKKLDEVVVIGYGSKTDEKNHAIEANMVLLENEAIRVASTLPDFVPGEQNGKKVAVYYTLPITFKLN